MADIIKFLKRKRCKEQVQYPACLCGAILKKTDSGWKCPIHGVLDEHVIRELILSYKGAGEAW